MEEYVGVPTSLMMDPGDRTEVEAIKFAVNRIGNAGFKAIELAPAQFKAVVGRNAEIFLEDAYGEEDRKGLKEILKTFRIVTVHGSNIIIHVPGTGEKEKGELWRPYLELMRFARDIGAHLVTFHSLQPSEGGSLNKEEMIRYHIEFGQLAAEYGQQWDLFVGFELATNFKFFLENQIMGRIGRQRFGFLFDLGHVALHFAKSADITDPVLQVAEEYIDKIWEFHAGGVQITSQGLREHRPLDRQNILDHQKFMELLERKKFRGPIIFEIFYQTSRPEQTLGSFSENLDLCTDAKRQVLKR